MDVRMHPLTLEFDDKTLEDELKSKVLNLPIICAFCVLGWWSLVRVRYIKGSFCESSFACTL